MNVKINGLATAFALNPLALTVLLLGLGSLPVVAAAQTSSGFQTGLTEEGARLALAKKNALTHVVQSGVIIRSNVRETMDVVVVFVRLSRGKVVAHGETAPIKLDPRAASTSTGMLLHGVLTEKHLAAVAPLELAEFVAGGFQNATKAISADLLVTDPGPAFPLGTARYGMVVAILPADATARLRSSVEPLFVTSHPTFE